MNMWPAKNGAYDPLTYDVRRTVSVRVMLHGPWVEFKFPRRNLPLRRWGKIIINVVLNIGNNWSRLSA